MRIGFDAKRATHNFRGLGNYSRGLIEGLLKYYPQEQLCLYSPPVKEAKAIDWLRSLPSSAQLKCPEGLIEKNIPTLWRSFLISNTLSRDHLDIFHGLSHEIPNRLDHCSFKKVVTMHDLIFLRYPEFFPLIDRMVYSQKFRYACKHSDLVLAICEQTKEDLIHFLGVDEKKIVVHYQSCDPLFYELRSTSELDSLRIKYQLHKPYIINVGAFEERKNQLGLLEAYGEMAHLIEEDLVFIGKGKKYRAQVIQKTNELKLNSRVHFFDHVSFEELPLFYQAAKILCFPSLFEGFGIPITEALFSKIPVITSFGSCFPESAGPNSYFIDPLSRSSIADGLVKILSNQKTQEQMISRGYEYVQRFHRRESTTHLMDIYTQLTAN
ncbi:MAG: glycosyltransferase family 4 protein [Bacteriovorax sp.]|nr:glycosyltransferase family 4 protein [Bacteriovorax sp.]